MEVIPVYYVRVAMLIDELTLFTIKKRIENATLKKVKEKQHEIQA